MNALTIEPLSLWPNEDLIIYIQWKSSVVGTLTSDVGDPDSSLCSESSTARPEVGSLAPQSGVPTTGLSAGSGDGYFTLALSCVLTSNSILQLGRLPNQLPTNYFRLHIMTAISSGEKDLYRGSIAGASSRRKYGRFLDSGNAVQRPELHKSRFSK